MQDALSYISDPQPVLVTHPSRPGATLVAEQQVHIHLLPPILVLHMKRFCYDTSVGGVVKVGKQVRFEPELDIPNGASFFHVRPPSDEKLTCVVRRCDRAWDKKELVAKVQVVWGVVSSWDVCFWRALYA